MKKWIISAVFYLIAVISGYTAYAEFIQEDKPIEHKDNEHETVNEKHVEGDHEEAADHEEEGEHAHDDSSQHDINNSEVVTFLEYDNAKISISLKNKTGEPVTELEINHEKLLHLIIVNSHLDKHYHVHPQKVEAGKFEVNQELPDGEYKAFIDIKPKDLSYTVSPFAFTVGKIDNEHGHDEILKADQSLIQTIEEETVKLQMSSMKINETITLDFDLNMDKLQPYLGAMGHVVILDEQANKYLHVHPADHDKPVFETQFNEPGKYKIWGEFKQDGKVRVFPFVVEIKE